MTHFPQPEAYSALGTIHRAKGLKGALGFALHHSQVVTAPAIIFCVLHHTYVPYRVAGWKVTTQRGTLHLQTIESRTAAEALQGRTLFVDARWLTQQLHKSAPWIGYQITDTQAGYLGRVTQALPQAGQTLLEITQGSKKLLVPLAFICKQDAQAQRAFTELPEGYLASFLQ